MSTPCDKAPHDFFFMSKSHNYIVVICAYCGQRRKLWESGKVEIFDD